MKYGVVQAIYIPLFMGVTKKLSIPHPTPIHISSAQSPVESRVRRVKLRLEKGKSVWSCGWRKAGQFEAAVRERQTCFSAVQDRHFWGRKELLSPEERQTFWVVREKRRSCEKWLVESCWSNQNQEMEIETLWIQIILSTKPRKHTFK